MKVSPVDPKIWAKCTTHEVVLLQLVVVLDLREEGSACVPIRVWSTALMCAHHCGCLMDKDKTLNQIQAKEPASACSPPASDNEFLDQITEISESPKSVWHLVSSPKSHVMLQPAGRRLPVNFVTWRLLFLFL